MPDITIRLSDEHHERIRQLASQSGQSIEEFMLRQSLPLRDRANEQQALEELKTLLQPRIEAAKRGETVPFSVEQVIAEAREELRSER